MRRHVRTGMCIYMCAVQIIEWADQPRELADGMVKVFVTHGPRIPQTTDSRMHGHMHARFDVTHCDGGTNWIVVATMTMPSRMFFSFFLSRTFVAGERGSRGCIVVTLV